MKALVKYGNGDKQVEIREVPVPEIGSGDVLLRVKAVGICGWDIEMWRHRMANPVTVPVIQGHEFCGVIEKVGAEVRGFAAGERVVSETAAVICGRCHLCRSGNYHLCRERKGFGYGVDGAFTDFVRVPERCLHVLPDGVPFEHACLTEPVCVAYQALVKLARIEPGQTVLVIGPGPIGLFAVQIAKLCGAGDILLAGTSHDQGRFDAAGKIGANHIINVSTEDAIDKIKSLTDGKGVALAVDAAGNSRALRLAVDAVAPMGEIVKIGWGPEPVNFSLDPLLSKAVRLQGTFSHNRPVWEAVLNLLRYKQIDMESMITHRGTLEEWEGAFEAVENREAIKAVMLFGQDE